MGLTICSPACVMPSGFRNLVRAPELGGCHQQQTEILEDVGRLGAQLLMQAALEAEVTEFLGRDRRAERGRYRDWPRARWAPGSRREQHGDIRCLMAGMASAGSAG
jgi:hypothetical protein